MEEILLQETNKSVSDGGEGDATYEAEEVDAWMWGLVPVISTNM